MELSLPLDHAAIERILVRLGMLLRTPRGRMATPAAWRHAGLEPPALDLDLSPSPAPAGD